MSEEELSKDELELSLETGYGMHTPEVLVAKKIDAKADHGINLEGLPIELLTKDVGSLSAPEFTAIRRQGFGGSDSSMVLGVNPYQDEKELIMSKILPYLPDTPEKRAQIEHELQVGKLSSVRKGNDLEPLIIQKASKALGVEIIKPEDMFRFKDYHYLSMNFDGVGVFPKTHDFGFLGNHHGYAPVEIKVVTVKGQHNYQAPKAVYAEPRFYVGLNPWQKALPPLTDMQLREWTIAQKAEYFGIPKYYYTQVQQEMMALDGNGGFLAALFENEWQLHIFYVQKDPYVQNALKIKGYELWQKIEKLKAYWQEVNPQTEEQLNGKAEAEEELNISNE